MSLKITGGNLKGRKVEILRKRGIRYTSSKVREAIFNILGDVNSKRVLELFAGSGIFSFEAISRGAEYATLIEREKDMINLIKKNAKSLMVLDRCQILQLDVFKAIPLLHSQGLKYDIIFLDPPYHMGYVDKTLEALERYPLYSNDCTLIVEHSKRERIGSLREDEGIVKSYGDTCLRILRKEKVEE